MTLVDTDTELTVINIFYMFKKVQYKHVKERHGENKNDPNWTSRDKKYTGWVKYHIRHWKKKEKKSSELQDIAIKTIQNETEGGKKN